MKNIIEEITKLTEEWRYLAGKEHCKDRDFHFYVNTKWSYGQPPKYFAQHFGYLLHDIEEEFDSYEEALNGLKEILKKEIKQFKEDGDENI